MAEADGSSRGVGSLAESQMIPEERHRIDLLDNRVPEVTELASKSSVVIPAYNAARKLPACLEALRDQSCKPLEVIVVDDGSTDSTAIVAQQHGALVLIQRHHGPAAARNLGMRNARGDLILFTDADCEPSPTWVEEMVRPFIDPTVVGVKGTYKTRQREIVAQLCQYEFEERYDYLDRFETIDFVDSYAGGFRTAVLREMGGFDPAFSEANNEDVDLSYRLADAGHHLMFNRRAVVYHHHRTNWSAYFRLKARRGYWRMIVYRLHPFKAVSDTYTPQLLKLQILLLGLSLFFGVVATVWAMSAWVAAFSLLLLLASAVPFLHRVGAVDKRLVPWAMVFVLVRALAFALGVVWGLAGLLSFRPQNAKGRAESIEELGGE